ncbi:HlyD family efflux transporter periplasmic adaptor subunit [Synechocystis sp. LKSZ1]|uniref:HlyD family efflux transporter periplasmic adaptor subunit n=1 Tax=Synechocystis sp. LKSZ1 TaxID=3144951 RepID=UPI00336C09B8
MNPLTQESSRNGQANSNGNGKVTAAMDNGTLASEPQAESPAKTIEVQTQPSLFQPEQSLILRQSPIWLRGIALGIMGVTVATITWASIATIEQVIPATGQLKPQDTVKDVQAPINGVVQKVLVKDNESVKAGQTLVIMDSTATESDLKAAQKIKQSLLQENEFYQTLLEKNLTGAAFDAAVSRLNLPWEVVSLAKNRAALVQENALYQTLLGLGNGNTSLSPDQESRLRRTQYELETRMMAARLEIQQLEKQLNQAQVQLASAQSQLREDQKILVDLESRNRKAISEAEKSLEIEERILGNVTPLLEEGALAKLQVEKQQQAVNDRYKQIIEQRVNGSVELDKQKQQVRSRLAEIDRLQQEERRLQNLIDQASARLTNTSAITEKDITDRIADNDKRLAEIDSQFTKVIVENNKRINELNGQISRSKVTLKYQEIKSPVNGTVFDLKATPGYVTPPNQTEPLLKIVPRDNLVAEVNVTNKDIGFVRTGMKSEVRIDSFPYSEFGDIKGEVSSIGSDALPPDQAHQYYRFPVRIKMESQQLKSQGRTIPLQSGMSITANIKVREKRTVISLFTELFTKKLETLETVR